ncbi:hypothetical protein Tco_0427461, partial [Tanacetum coccineum]
MIKALNANSVFMKNNSSGNGRSSSETACSNSVKESNSDFETKDMHAIKYKMLKVKYRCMAYLRSLHSHLQTQEIKVNMGKAVDASLVVTKSSGTKSEVQDESSMSGNNTDADDAYIRPVYDEEPMAE